LCSSFWTVEDQLPWLGRLMVASHAIEEGLLQLVSAGKMGGLQELALDPTSPDLDLIQPGGVGGQPRERHRQLPLRCPRQFLNPTRELLGCVSRTSIENQSDGLHTTTLGTGLNNRLQKRAEIDEALARMTLARDQPISDTKPPP